MAAIPAALGVIGAIMSADGQRRAGDAQMAGAQYQAAQDKVNAGQDMAAGSADVAAQATKIKLLQSHALAVAGASGAGALDPDVVNIVSGIAKVGEYNAGMMKYNAQSRANAELNQGNEALITGQAQQQGSRTAATGTILSGLSNAWDKY